MLQAVLRFASATCVAASMVAPWASGTAVVSSSLAAPTVVGALPTQQRSPNLRITATTVPDVVGDSLAKAQEKLKSAGLVAGELDQVESPLPARTIARQEPAAGTRVRVGTPVRLWLAVPGPRPDMRQKPERPPPDIGRTIVPAVIGDALSVATAKILDAKLTMGTITPMRSSQPPGTVVRQDPAAKEPVAARTAVALWVASTPPRKPDQPEIDQPPPDVPFTVPNVVGDLITVAVSKLGDDGFAAGDVVEEASDRPAGTVVRQAPAAGTRARLRPRVNLWVAAPPPPVEVPSLVGRTEDDARAALEGARLRPGRRSSRPSPGPPGLVLEQRPAPGDGVPIGSSVDYVLSVAEPRRMVRVPDVHGLDLERARVELGGRDLIVATVREREARDRSGVVVDQSPQPDAEVPPGTGIDLWLAAPPPKPPPPPDPDEAPEGAPPVIDIDVPDVVGLSMGAAFERLQGAGLTIGPVRKEQSSSAPDTVLGQQPQPRTLVARGTPVAMVVAEVSLREVPNLVGFTKVVALDALRNGGLEPGRVTEQASSSPEGTIVQQAPSAGSSVPVGSAVDLFVATPSGLPTWVLGIAGLALTAGVASVAGYRIARRMHASVDVTPHLDVGLQELDADEEGLMRSEVRIGAAWDSGDQHLEPADVHVVSEHTEGE